MLEAPLMEAQVRIDHLAEALEEEVNTFLDELGEMLVESVKRRIKTTKLTPGGDDFEMWAERTAIYRERKGNADQGILWDTGELLDSIRFEQDGNMLRVGTPVSYAPYLQDGTINMPARPFIGFSETDLAGIDDLATAFMKRIAE